MAIKTYRRGDSSRLSKNFKVSELLCKGAGCCAQGQIDDKLVGILQNIRDHFGKPVHVSSAYRCSAWNKAVGGESNSYHRYGRAADIKVKDIAPAEVAKYAESVGVKGIGLYETDADGYFVHVDTRSEKSFWYGQKQEKRQSFGGREGYVLELKNLEKGDRGEAVRALQILLVGNGYDFIPDGIFGEKTLAAVKDYQRKQGMGVDGIAGKMTRSALLGASK